jgi:hypothetical protein
MRAPPTLVRAVDRARNYRFRPVVKRLLKRPAMVAGAAAAMMGWTRIATAQQSGPAVQPELRADVIIAHAAAGQMAAGAVGSIGESVRLGGDLGAGVVGGDGRGTRLGTRVDVYGRFHLDPRAQSRWAPYIAAGGSLRADNRSRGQLYALAALGVEGPAARGVRPAFELGLGGGVRFGFALRRRGATAVSALAPLGGLNEPITQRT